MEKEFYAMKYKKINYGCSFSKKVWKYVLFEREYFPGRQKNIFKTKPWTESQILVLLIQLHG